MFNFYHYLIFGRSKMNLDPFFCLSFFEFIEKFNFHLILMILSKPNLEKNLAWSLYFGKDFISTDQQVLGYFS